MCVCVYVDVDVCAFICLCVCPRVCACARACAVCVYIHTLIHKHVSNTQFLFLSVSCPNERPRSLTQPQAKPVFSYPHREKTRTHSHNTLPNAQILFSCVFHQLCRAMNLFFQSSLSPLPPPLKKRERGREKKESIYIFVQNTDPAAIDISEMATVTSRYFKTIPPTFLTFDFAGIDEPKANHRDKKCI